MIRPRKNIWALLAMLFVSSLALFGCSGSGSGGDASTSSSQDAGDGSTSGPAYSEPSVVEVSTFDPSAAETFADAAIDISTRNEGYVGVSATASTRLKFQVLNGDAAYNYDLPNDGTPIIVPMNMGNGTYTFRVMQNTSGSSYVEAASTSAEVDLSTDFAPYLHPNVFCDYTSDSQCVKTAYQLCADAENEGDVARAIYDYIVKNISYDDAKAAQLATSSGYVPDPDSTLSSKTGICFDYASLAAAMFRSLGIPCQIVTGYVSPDDIYHAWNMIYIDGQWVSAAITVEADTWTRIDLTFAAADGGSSTIGDGTTYTDRYVY